MPQPLTPVFKLGQRAVLGARYAITNTGNIFIAFGYVHHFQHVFFVLLPVGGQMEDTARF